MIPTPNRERRRAIANNLPAREEIASEIARRVSHRGARPEDWLNEKWVYRLVYASAVEVLNERSRG
jgi:hypothetical protein